MENNERKPGESIKQWRARIRAQKKKQKIQDEIDRGELLDASIVVAPRFEATISQGTDGKRSRKNNHRVGQESVFGEREFHQNRSLAERAFNDLTDAVGLTSPPTYQDGYGRTLNAEVSLQESAQGQELKRMGETAKGAAELAATGFAFGNPLTASEAVAPLITASQAYWIGHGINDGAQRIENIGEGVQNFVEDPSWQNAGVVAKEVPMLALDVAGALPVARTIVETSKNAIPAAQQAAQRIVGSVDDAITTATKQAVESGVVGVNELPAQLAARATSTPTITSPILDRTVGIQNRVFTGDPVFPKTTWQIPAFNTNSAYRLTGQSQIDDMVHTGFVRPKSGKIKGGHTNEVHWSAGNTKSGYNIQPGQYILESPRGLVDGTSNAIGVNDLSHVWTTRNGQVVDVIDEIRPHTRTISSPLSSRGSYTFYERPSTYFKTQSSIVGQPVGNELVTPLDAIDAIKEGRRMAGSFFKHPIVKESYAHNQALAKRLGIELPDRPADISEMVIRPVKVGWNTSDNEIANIAQGYYGDPDVTMNFQWKLRPKSDWEAAARHESMHLGYYSAPIRPKTVTQEYYNTISKPSYNFWKWKTDKLLRPEYRDGYLSDVWGGEAGPNLIDIGRELGVKLGQKYPGDTEFLNMMNNYKGLKSNFVPHLQLDTRAGRRHVWDAMTGKYFAIPAVGIGLGLIANNKDEENPQQ